MAAVGYLSSGTDLGILAEVLLLAVVLDLGIKYARFRSLRIPDAAIAIGAFLVVLVQPSSFDIPMAAVVVCTIVLRLLLRYQGHPILNPTAFGLAIGFFLLGTQVPWNVGGPALLLTGTSSAAVSVAGTLEVALIVVFGLLLVLRQKSTWRFPLFFFLAYLPLFLILSRSLSPSLSISAYWVADVYLSPQILFFAFFMVPEPRTAPAAPRWIIVFSLLVGGMSAIIPVALNSNPQLSVVGAIAPFLALFVGNGFAVAQRWWRRPKTVKVAAPRSVPRRGPSRYGGASVPRFPSSPAYPGGLEYVGGPGPNPPPWRPRGY